MFPIAASKASARADLVAVSEESGAFLQVRVN